MNNQECKTRPQVVNVNGDEPVFFPFSIETSKCSGSCNNINYPYAKICVPDIIKKLNVKVFNLMSRTNETRFKEWHEAFTINVSRIEAYFVYFHWYLKKYVTHVEFDTRTQITIY